MNESVEINPLDDCPMLELSHGEICTHCNVCGRFKDQDQPTREEMLEEFKQFHEMSDKEKWL